MLVGAFAVGFVLQLAVTEVPYLVTMFGTAPLAASEWISLLFLAAFPILTHEMFVILFRADDQAETAKLPERKLARHSRSVV